MKYPLLSLSASAGSGKTYRLVLRYLELLFLGERPSSILALTFTKKAAKEMREKIEKTLFDIHNGCGDLNIINYIESNYNIHVSDVIDKVYKTFLEEDLKITTIDSFFQKILKSFCWYAGVEHNFELKSDEIDKISLIMMGMLYDNQHEYDRFLAFCHNNKMNLNNIIELCLFLDTFKETISDSMFNVSNNSNIDTLKDEAVFYGNKIRESYFAEKGKLCDALIFDTYDEILHKGKTWLTKNFIEEYRDFKCLQNSNDDFNKLKKIIKEIFLVEESIYLSDINFMFKIFLKSKTAYLKKTNRLNFNDVASRVYKLLIDKKIDSDFLYFRLDSNINHILIDEFQDTSLLQYRILEPLIEEIKSGIGTKKNLRSFFYVGDVKQSIYRFRGGKPELFNYASNGMHKENMGENYRSSKEIVEFVNFVFADIIDGFVPQKPMLQTNGYVSVCSSENMMSSLYGIVSDIIDAGGSENNIAILVFDNKTVVSIESFLRECGVNVVIDTSSRLVSHNEVRAIIEILKYLTTKNSIHLHAFYSLLNLEYDSNASFLDDIDLNEKPSKIIYLIMNRFFIGSLSAKKFLEISFKYINLDEMLLEVDFLDDEIVSEDLNGVRIMTIHKSKGLEFPHVIVFDKEGGNTSNTNKLILSTRDGINIDRIYKRSNNIRVALDCDYRNVLDIESKMENDDLKNQLYVAFTRAKNSMHILIDANKQKKSGISILSLEDQSFGDFEKCILNVPNRDFILKDDTSVVAGCDIFRNLGRQNDIQILEKKDEKEDECDVSSVNYGLAFHYCMEQKIKNNISDEILFNILQNRYGLYLDKTVISRIIANCNLSLQNDKFNEILHKGIVKCEIPFLSSGALQRRLDLLVVGEKEAFIIDYKSGNHSDKYVKQMQEYKQNVSDILKMKVYGYIFYTKDKGRLVEIT